MSPPLESWPKEYGRKDAMPFLIYEDGIILAPKLDKDSTQKRDLYPS